MITLTERTVERDEFDAMFEEAVTKAAHEVTRFGSRDVMRDAMWNDYEINRTAVIEKDSDIVGYLSFTEQGSSTVRISTPCYGPDSNGSRSWYYTKDYQKGVRDFVRSIGCDRMVMIIREGSPVSEATKKIWGTYGKYFEAAEVVDADSDVKEMVGADARILLLRVKD